MEAYSGFAGVYDLFMDNVPYEEWSRYVVDLLREYDIRDGLVLDLGCGTGKLTRRLARAGFDMIGVDNSEEMLSIARSGGDDPGDAGGILYLLQDMREFELFGTVRAVVSVCDSINYLLGEDELLRVFSLVNNYLDPGGIFIFDLNTIYKYRELLGETTICENREEGSFIWENAFDEADGINEYDLTLYIREENGYYRRYEETHFQRAYPPDTVGRLLAEAGMEVVAVFDAFTREPVKEKSERISFVARECRKGR